MIKSEAQIQARAIFNNAIAQYRAGLYTQALLAFHLLRGLVSLRSYLPIT